MSGAVLRRRAALTLAACLPLAACVNFGPDRLNDDQEGYTQALDDAQKYQTLLNIVRLRYADPPVFLDITQVISAYQLQSTISANADFFPSLNGGSELSTGGGVQLQQSPTFTFQPVAGEAFAESFIRPLSPEELLPLALTGIPIDVLFRLAVQSVNGMRNISGLEAAAGYGTPAFFQLLIDLRRLQIAGLLDVRSGGGKAEPPGPGAGGGLLLTINDSPLPELEPLVATTRQLLGMAPDQRDAPVVYGEVADRPGEIAILTRPMLSVLGQVSGEIAMPAADIKDGRTAPTVPFPAILHRPTIIVQNGPNKPSGSAVAVKYGGNWFWIAEDDFDSKLAFALIQVLLALAQTSTGPGTVVTIPSR